MKLVVKRILSCEQHNLGIGRESCGLGTFRSASSVPRFIQVLAQPCDGEAGTSMSMSPAPSLSMSLLLD